MASNKKKASITRVRAHGRDDGPEWPLALPGQDRNGARYEHPRIKNPQVPGEREKMLEKREKLTLQAFRIAYENRHRRKS